MEEKLVQAKAAKSSQIPLELNDLVRSIELLAEAIDELRDRMSSVLTTEKPTVEQDIMKDEQIVPLASIIREQRRKIQNATFLVNEIRNRCEL